MQKNKIANFPNFLRTLKIKYIHKKGGNDYYNNINDIVEINNNENIIGILT